MLQKLFLDYILYLRIYILRRFKMSDITVKFEEGKFNFRVAVIVEYNEKILSFENVVTRPPFVGSYLQIAVIRANKASWQASSIL